MFVESNNEGENANADTNESDNVAEEISNVPPSDPPAPQGM